LRRAAARLDETAPRDWACGSDGGDQLAEDVTHKASTTDY